VAITHVTRTWLQRLRQHTADGSVAPVGLYGALLVVCVVAGLLSPAFYQPTNLFNIIRQASALGILALGQTLVLIGGGIDLSVVSTMQLSAVLVAGLSRGQDERLWPAVAFCLALGAAVGLVNGFLIARWQVPAFIATLGVSIVTTGLRLVATFGAPPGSVPPLLRVFGQQSTGPVPNAVILLLGLALLSGFVLRRSIFGRELYATGGNRAAARLSGVRVERLTLLTYVYSGVLAALAGLVLAGYVGYADQWLGRGYELDSIAAPIVGGATFAGGRGSIAGTVTGVLLVAALLNLVLLLNLPAEWQSIVRGVVIVVAVALQSLGRRDA
jgi:ribose/xylose/arabinose/galactoside ABC-type transport system permease subunit